MTEEEVFTTSSLRFYLLHVLDLFNSVSSPPSANHSYSTHNSTWRIFFFSLLVSESVSTQRNGRTQGSALSEGLVIVFGTIYILAARFGRDNRRHTPQYQHNNPHLLPPVVFTQYSERIRAMQDRALDLLEDEPLRGYTNLGNVLLDWLIPAPEDDRGPVEDHRLGPQDPSMEVPRRNRL